MPNRLSAGNPEMPSDRPRLTRETTHTSTAAITRTCRTPPPTSEARGPNHSAKAPSIGAPFLGELSVREGQQTEQRCLVWEWDGELTLQDFLEDRGFPGSLASHLQEQGYRTGRLLEDEAVVKRVIRDLLGALAQLHAIGIVHRDIKPANLLMSSTGSTKGRFKIIDFGAACDLRAGYNCECGCPGGGGRGGPRGTDARATLDAGKTPRTRASWTRITRPRRRS